MLKNTNPTQTQAWKNLEAHFKLAKTLQLKDLFSMDNNRFSKFSTTFEDILIDYSKNRVTEETIELLLNLAN